MLPTEGECFSPVAGIQWVETPEHKSVRWLFCRFSPVAGIQWVETRAKTIVGMPRK